MDKLPHKSLLVLLAIALALGIASLSWAAQSQSQSQTPSASQSQAQAQSAKRDSDITRGELRSFDQFLDNHPEAREALQQNPSLINNPVWVSKHPELKDWLEDHPYAREELKENPAAFMRRERAFEQHEAPESDITRAELRNFDQFLDSHREVAEELRENPGLINNPEWVSKHPELKDWLEDHPRAREELKENPAAFMHRERAFEQHEAPENDITRAELRNFDQFLDSHREIAEELRENPNLINNPEWVSKHPQLKDWLEDHPNARSELKENPTAFMRRERHFEKGEAAKEHRPKH